MEKGKIKKEQSVNGSKLLTFFTIEAFISERNFGIKVVIRQVCHLPNYITKSFATTYTIKICEKQLIY